VLLPYRFRVYSFSYVCPTRIDDQIKAHHLANGWTWNDDAKLVQLRQHFLIVGYFLVGQTMPENVNVLRTAHGLLRGANALLIDEVGIDACLHF
jgi:hypothetical protein